MKNKTNYYPKFIPWENTPYKPNIKNKTKVKAEWEKEFNRLVSGEWKIGCYECDNGIKIDEVKDFIKKNFVAKGEVREMIEDIQATEIADHSLASLIEKLHKYKKSLE